MVTTVNVRASSRSLRDFAKRALPVHVQRRPAKTDIAFRRTSTAHDRGRPRRGATHSSHGCVGPSAPTAIDGHGRIPCLYFLKV